MLVRWSVGPSIGPHITLNAKKVAKVKKVDKVKKVAKVKKSRQNSSPKFLAKICHHNLSPKFVAKIFRQSSSPKFVGKICWQNLLPKFVAKICPTMLVRPLVHWSPFHFKIKKIAKVKKKCQSKKKLLKFVAKIWHQNLS
jgi:hypothetical protein